MFVFALILGTPDIVSSAKFVLIVEKDATFQRLLDDDLCSKLFPCIMITVRPTSNIKPNTHSLIDSSYIYLIDLISSQNGMCVCVSLVRAKECQM